jgi:hypothetical protein
MKRIGEAVAESFVLLCGIAIAAVLAVGPPRAFGQNLPPPGAYQPIPDYSGTNAGLLFRQAINNRFSGVQPISPAIVSLSFANLPAEQDGTLFYCIDCQKVSPCLSGGAGAWALGQNGAWSCATGASSLSMSGDVTGSTAASTVQTVEGGKTPVVTSGVNSASGTATAAALNGFNVASQINASNPIYGVLSTSTTTETATTTAGNASVPLGAIGPFVVGNGVLLPHAGPTASVTTPTGLTGVGHTYGFNALPMLSVTATNNGYGAACNVDTTNASCTTSYTATVMAVDANGGLSPAATAATITGGPATLSVWNSNYWSWTCGNNAIAYVVLGCTGASCTPTAIWGVVPKLDNGCNFWDFGNHFGSDTTYGGSISTGVQATGANQDLSTEITGVSGSTITLATAPGASGTFTAIPDNAPVINAAIAVAATGGGDVLLPAGAATYNVSQLNFFNTQGVHFGGNPSGWESGGAPTATAVNYVGSIGRPMFYMNWAPGATIHDLHIGTGSTPGIINYIDADSWVTGGLQRSKGNEVYKEMMGLGPNTSAGAWTTIGVNSSGGENEFVYLHNNNTSSMYGYVGAFVAAGYQTENTEIDHNEFGRFNVCVQAGAAGTINEKNNDTSTPYIYHYASNAMNQWNIDGDYTDGENAFWFYGASLTGGGSTVRVSNSVVHSTPGPNGFFLQAAGNETWTADLFQCSGSNNCLISPGWTSAGTPVFMNDTFTSTYPASYPAAFKPPFGLPIADGGGVNSMPAFVVVGGSSANGTGPTGVGLVMAGNAGNTSANFLGYPVNITLPNATLTGTPTAGTANCSQSMQGTLKTATCYLNGYQETGTAQTFTFPTAFSTAPNLLASCGTYNPSATATVLTLPANAAMTAETCNVTAIGQ